MCDIDKLARQSKSETMEGFTQEEFNYFEKYGKKRESEFPEAHEKLRSVYDKLGKLCDLLPKDQYETSIRRNPKNQGGVFEVYHWAKIYPKKLFDIYNNKICFVIGVDSEGFNIHIDGLKDYQPKEEVKKIREETYHYIDNIESLKLPELAQEISSYMKKYNDTLKNLANTLGINHKESEMKNNEEQEIINLLKYKKQIILQGPPGTGKTRLAKEIANKLTKESTNNISLKSEETDRPEIILDEAYIRSHLKKGDRIKGKKSSFTIVSIDGDGIYLSTPKTKKEGWIATYKNVIKSYNNKLYNEKSRTGNGPYEDAIALFFSKKISKSSPIQATELNYSLIQFHPSYTYEDFVRGIVSKPLEDGSGVKYEAENKTLADFAQKALIDWNKAKKKKDENISIAQINAPIYVLIIDEINRANLSSVLGELIYALEYRGEEVESMYTVNGDNKLILPPNLYIIGTMNTADRSVGHIDYAIRRRFSFVDVLPKNLSTEEGVTFDSDLFKQVSLLFVKEFELQKDYSKEKIKRAETLSEEFDPKDVWLGHSYFIDKTSDGGNMQMRLDYEIKPILLEYVKDGVLIGNDILEKINNLKVGKK